MTLPDRYHEQLTTEDVMLVAQAIAAADEENPNLDDINAIHIVDHLDETQIAELDRWNTRPKRAKTDLIQATYPVLADVNLITMSDDDFMIIVQPGSHEVLSDADALHDLLATLDDTPTTAAEDNTLEVDASADNVEIDEESEPSWDDLQVEDDSATVDEVPQPNADDISYNLSPTPEELDDEEAMPDKDELQMEDDSAINAASSGEAGDILGGFSIHKNNQAAVESGRSLGKRRSLRGRNRPPAANDDSTLESAMNSTPDTSVPDEITPASTADTPETPAADKTSPETDDSEMTSEEDTATAPNRPRRSNQQRSTSRRSTNRSATAQGDTRQPPWSSMKSHDDETDSATRSTQHNRRGRHRMTTDDLNTEAAPASSTDDRTRSTSSTRRGRTSHRTASSSDEEQSSQRRTTRSSNRSGRRGSYQTAGPRARTRSGDTSSRNSGNTSPLETLSLPNGKTLQFSQYTLNKLIEEHGSLTDVIEWCLSHYSELSDDSDT